MSNTTAGVLLDTIMEWGVDTIFGLPGDGINGIMEALRVRKEKIRFIHVRHEEAAAFMACAYAKYTGKLGVCLATSGPGGIHLLNGLYDAKLDGQPVLAITGLPFHDLIHTYTQQDVELDKLFENVSVYNVRVMGPAHMESVADLACRSALSYHGVAHITIPVDFQDMKSERLRTERNVPHHNTSLSAHSAQAPDLAALRASADILNSGKKVALLVGQGANHATNELLEVARLLGAPIVKALLGKTAVPDDNAYSMGGIGLLGTRASQWALENCDTLLMVGTSFPYMEFYPKPGKARAIQIELNPMRIGLRYPVEIGLVGDSKVALTELLPHIKERTDRSFLTEAQAEMKNWNALMEERGTRTDKPMKPQVVAHELNKLLTNDAIVSSDSGTITTWWARHLVASGERQFSCSGNLATMACGLPYAIAAQIAYPERLSIAFVGDGGFTMLMGEFATAVKYKLPVKVIIIKNDTLGQIKWEQMVFLGNPEYGCELNPIDFAAYARACGGEGVTIEDPADCRSVLQKALTNGKPTVIEAIVDPFEPPLPAKITNKQAAHFAESLVRGEPNAKEIALTILSNKVRELV